MIKELIKEIDNETIDILSNMKEQAILSVIETDYSKGNKMYLNSIKRKGKELGVLVDHGEPGLKKLSRNVLILKPEAAEEMYSYTMLKEQLRYMDVEGKNQEPTINAAALTIDKIAFLENRSDLHILIINRSKDLGRPLADELLDRDYTVTVAHSKSSIRSYSNYDVIVTATGSSQDDLYNKLKINPSQDKWWVDVGYDLTPDKDNEKLIQNIGRLTTSYLFNKVAKRY